jgi:hypothetical protein
MPRAAQPTGLAQGISLLFVHFIITRHAQNNIPGHINLQSCFRGQRGNGIIAMIQGF